MRSIKHHQSYQCCSHLIADGYCNTSICPRPVWLCPYFPVAQDRTSKNGHPRFRHMHISIYPGKLTYQWNITIFNGKTHCKWPFPRGMLVITRGYLFIGYLQGRVRCPGAVNHCQGPPFFFRLPSGEKKRRRKGGVASFASVNSWLILG